jgi:DNA-binding NarL/FixJ family response regulator
VTIRVLVVDDQALVRSGFAMILGVAPDIEVVGEAGTGVEAVTAARLHRPDVVLMDIRMPEMDGIEATTRILAAAAAEVRVLILTTFDPDEYVYRALLAPSVTRRLIGRFTEQLSVDTSVARRLERLTEREREVATGVARGWSNAEIATDMVIGAATVKSHVSSILTKLGLRDRAQIVVFAYESGLITAGDHDIGH